MQFFPKKDLNLGQSLVHQITYALIHFFGILARLQEFARHQVKVSFLFGLYQEAKLHGIHLFVFVGRVNDSGKIYGSRVALFHIFPCTLQAGPSADLTRASVVLRSNRSSRAAGWPKPKYDVTMPVARDCHPSSKTAFMCWKATM